jgi:multifunctional methyltransferase subunit TRM112
MRLITHNMLVCNVKGCKTNNFPLRIKALQIEKIESEFKADFIRHLLPKIHWVALVQGAKDIGVTIPEVLPDNANDDEVFLRNLHHVLFDIHIKEGELVCNNCNRSFPITHGIPNMLLKEDEV